MTDVIDSMKECPLCGGAMRLVRSVYTGETVPRYIWLCECGNSSPPGIGELAEALDRYRDPEEDVRTFAEEVRRQRGVLTPDMEAKVSGLAGTAAMASVALSTYREALTRLAAALTLGDGEDVEYAPIGRKLITSVKLEGGGAYQLYALNGRLCVELKTICNGKSSSILIGKEQYLDLVRDHRVRSDTLLSVTFLGVCRLTIRSPYLSMVLSQDEFNGLMRGLGQALGVEE